MRLYLLNSGDRAASIWLAIAVPTSTDAYLICGTPRTGSTLLCGLLRSTGVAGWPESYFRLPDEQSWADRWQLPRDSTGSFDYQDYLRAAVTEGTTPNGVFGVRVMWGTLDEIVAKLSTARPNFAGTDLDLLTSALGRMRFIHLWRDDTLAQAVSWARAEQTHFWQHGDTARPGHEPRFDFEQIHGLIQTIKEHNAAWRDWFGACDVQPHLVRYEDLTADMIGVTTSILDFLGLQLPADRAITPRHRRQADQLNEEWIARYNAVTGQPNAAADSD
jgi:trehalose 2-sulfotransferase